VGAAEDIRTQDIAGFTPMLCACRNGYLHVAKWLFEVGAAEDISTPTADGETPLGSALRNEHFHNAHFHVIVWLILQGAANNDEGHVDHTILCPVESSRHWAALIISLQCLDNENNSFNSLFLPATSVQRSSISSLVQLEGQEEMLRLIADFVDVLRGRKLRNAREAVAALELHVSFENDMTELSKAAADAHSAAADAAVAAVTAVTAAVTAQAAVFTAVHANAQALVAALVAASVAMQSAVAALEARRLQGP